MGMLRSVRREEVDVLEQPLPLVGWQVELRQPSELNSKAESHL